MAKGKGYQPSKRESRRTAQITFEPGHQFYGAELELALSAPVGLSLELAELAETKQIDLSTLRAQDVLLRRFGDRCLLSWNVLDDDGDPVPANGAGLVEQEPEFVNAILTAWVAEAMNPSAPLVAASPDGVPSPVG